MYGCVPGSSPRSDAHAPSPRSTGGLDRVAATTARGSRAALIVRRISAPCATAHARRAPPGRCHGAGRRTAAGARRGRPVDALRAAGAAARGARGGGARGAGTATGRGTPRGDGALARRPAERAGGGASRYVRSRAAPRGSPRAGRRRAECRAPRAAPPGAPPRPAARAHAPGRHAGAGALRRDARRRFPLTTPGAHVKTLTLIAALLAAALQPVFPAAVAAEAPPASPAQPVAPAAPTVPAAPAAPAANAELEAQLETARRKLEEAAHEVAALSAQMSGTLIEQVMPYVGVGRAIIGVQRDNPPQGARVSEVSPGGPAAEAGIRAG